MSDITSDDPFTPIEASLQSTAHDSDACRRAHDIASQTAGMRSLLVVKDQRVAWEAYYGQCTAGSLHRTYSVTKSVTGALVGVAIQLGLLPGLETPVSELIPELARGAGNRAGVRLGHLLTMTDGTGPPPDGDENCFGADPIRDWLGLSREHPPGTAFRYSAYQPHVLAHAIRAASGRIPLAFAAEHLFSPVGIANVEWLTDGTGCNVGESGLRMTARDMARFGLLFLRAGACGGRQILSANWVRQATRAHNPGGEPVGAPYGYLWWVDRFRGHPCFFAAGAGGQVVHVVPGLSLVTVTAADREHDVNPWPIVSAVVEACTPRNATGGRSS